MASSANVPKATNGAGIEAGDLSPEEAERYASAFRPIWDFDDAPFSAGPAQLSDSDVRELSASSISSDVDATLKVGALNAAALPEILEAPAPAPARPASQRPPPPKPKVPNGEAARAVPQARPAQRPSFRDASSSIELPALRKSNKGLFIGIGAVVLVAGLFFGIRAMNEEPDKAPGATPAAATAAQNPAHEEARIPPPPEPAATTTTTTATTTAPEPTTPAPTPAPTPAKAEKQEKPEKPEPVAAQPHAAPPPPRPTHSTPRSSPPPAPPKPRGGGSIVRDNPF